jgi:hypothetical protein
MLWAMTSSQAARVLLVRAVEETRPASLSSEALLQAAVEAGPLEDEAAWLARRAQILVDHALGPWRALLAMTDALAPSFAIAFLLPAAAGLLTNYLGPAQKIHVLYNPIVFLVGWNLCALAWLGARAVRGRGAPRAASWTFRRALPAVWVRIHRVTADAEGGAADAARVAKVFWSHWAALGGPIFALGARRLLHVAALGVAVGAILGMYVRGLFFEYDVVWRSTFLRDPETIARVLGVVLGPAAAVAGSPLPDAETVRPMLGAQGVGAAPWIWLYTVSAFLFIGVPRASLAGLASLRLRRLRGGVRIDLDDPYYREIVGRAKQVQLDRIAEAITSDVRSELAVFAGGVADFVCERLYDARITPKLRAFREQGGRLAELEQAIAQECTDFQPELEEHLEGAQGAFASSLGRAVARTIGADVEIDAARPTRGLGEAVGGAAQASSDGARWIGQTLSLTVGSAVSSAAALVTATLSGGFGKSIGAAILVSLLHTTGPIAFLIGAVVGLVAAAGALYLGRERAAAATKRVPLPAWAARLVLGRSRLERLIERGRSRSLASVKERIQAELEPLTPEIAHQVWLGVRPLVAERYRPAAS